MMTCLWSGSDEHRVDKREGFAPSRTIPPIAVERSQPRRPLPQLNGWRRGRAEEEEGKPVQINEVEMVVSPITDRDKSSQASAGVRRGGPHGKPRWGDKANLWPLAAISSNLLLVLIPYLRLESDHVIGGGG
ncbi:hypothetical protein BaRGS_00039072, partial [Batillaria attramentaria]